MADAKLGHVVWVSDAVIRAAVAGVGNCGIQTEGGAALAIAVIGNVLNIQTGITAVGLANAVVGRVGRQPDAGGAMAVTARSDLCGIQPVAAACGLTLAVIGGDRVQPITATV